MPPDAREAARSIGARLPGRLTSSHASPPARLRPSPSVFRTWRGQVAADPGSISPLQPRHSCKPWYLLQENCIDCRNH